MPPQKKQGKQLALSLCVQAVGYYSSNIDMLTLTCYIIQSYLLKR